ncbi:hypothetical protein GCM10011610_01210 [Nocardia rhizosphaerihabitans]|uniref:Uncharacterized protein n=1 Tax=Nocardia rhizosphaerihabitans TaxID=1691570 RepID=A0ABQ2K4G3_9NOCA|nr:hypothetical protein GCM10011610_01210 [Nocardia rhizosphaerihabitans]
MAHSSPLATHLSGARSPASASGSCTFSIPQVPLRQWAGLDRWATLAAATRSDIGTHALASLDTGLADFAAVRMRLAAAVESAPDHLGPGSLVPWSEASTGRLGNFAARCPRGGSCKLHSRAIPKRPHTRIRWALAQWLGRCLRAMDSLSPRSIRQTSEPDEMQVVGSCGICSEVAEGLNYVGG